MSGKQATSRVIWITGLSGAGKTTIGREVAEILSKRSPNTVFLDGDSFREVIGNETSHDPDGRLKNAQRIGRLCKLLSDQGLNVVCSTMSLFPEVWSWNRAHLPGYVEVYLKASKEALLKRDTKGIYQRAAQGNEQNVVGWDLPFREPLSAHLVIETDDSTPGSINRNVELIMQYLNVWNDSQHEKSVIHN
jgi:cytidine diphosphoramidate kinase